MTEETKKPLSLFTAFETDPSATDDGVLFEIIPGVKFRVRRFNSKKVTAVRERLLKPYKHLTKNGQELPDDIATLIGTKQLAEAVIVDWEGVIDENGIELPYSVKNAYVLLERLPDVKDEIAAFSLNVANYLAAERDEEVKN